MVEPDVRAPASARAAMGALHELNLHYPLEAIWGDYARSVVGAGLCLVPASFVSSPVVLGLLLLVGGSFAVFGVMTWRRQLTSFRLDADNLYRWAGGGDRKPASAPEAGRVLAWRDLRAMSLSYFSVRGDGRSGWMQLKLLFEGQTLRVDSRLEHFEALVAVAAAWAHERGLAFDPTTLSNLDALGIEGAAPPDAV